MFLGQYRHNLDSKDRLTIPARYRELLVDGAYVLQGFDRNLMVLTTSAYQMMAQRVNQMNLADPLTRLLRRLVFSSASYVEVDKTGRILIPEFLRAFAEVDGDVVLNGAGTYFEIWSPAHWDEQLAQMADTEANAHRFAILDLSNE